MRAFLRAGDMSQPPQQAYRYGPTASGGGRRQPDFEPSKTDNPVTFVELPSPPEEEHSLRSKQHS